MDSQTVDRTDQKIELARELGLENILNNYSLKKETQRLLAMKFKPITEQQIEQKLGVFAYNAKISKQKTKGRIIGTIGGILTSISLFGLTATGAESHSAVNTFWFFMFALSALLFIVGSALCSFVPDWRDVESCALSEWEHDIPYGALLAAKEAKENGFEKLEIYYPTEWKNQDPVIVAYKFGKMFEIFSWDDGKVYE